jgi:hypothetical protein
MGRRPLGLFYISSNSEHPETQFTNKRYVSGVTPCHSNVAMMGRPLRHRHSSSASRFTAGEAGFLTLIQSADRPNRYGEPRRFDTMPSQPSLQA